jgi:hypothetical protein
MDLYKKEHRHFRTQLLNDLRRLSTAELIINSETESIILAWSSLTILAERGLPVDGTYEQWIGACHPYLAAPCDNKSLLELHSPSTDVAATADACVD